jgi:hypothetical protein
MQIDFDRMSLKKGFAVRIPLSFGQGKPQERGSCPNTALIRTMQASRKSLLSEYHSHSDRASHKKEFPVRIPLSFGQCKPQERVCCPNTTLIRTGQAIKKSLLSEYRSHSDKADLNKGVPVRTPLSFGQGKP